MKKMKKGQALLWRGVQCTYQASLTPDKVQVYLADESRYEVVPIGELTPIRIEALEKPEKPDALVASEEAWQQARLRFDQVVRYLQGARDKSALSLLAKKMNVSEPRAYQIVQKYDEDEGPSCMLSSRRGRKVGATLVLSSVESVIREAIKTEWKGPGTTHRKVWKRVRELCVTAGYPVPSVNTVTARINLLGEREKERRRSGSKSTNDTFQARPGVNRRTTPLAVLEMDHCVVDCIIVDETTRRPLCRPWATIIIDRCTRIVMGFYLSIHHPDSFSVAMAITHATLTKDNWLSLLGDEDLDYPYYGVPEEICMDNAKEFVSKVLKRAAEKHRIKLAWRPFGKPWYGGTIERLNGTLNMSYIHFLPGTTLSDVKLRGEYDSSKESCLTFSEFRLWFSRCIQQYHNEKHRILGMTPHEKWMECFSEGGKLSHPALVDDAKGFALDFMPEKRRVVSRDGVSLNSFKYWCPALSPYICPGKRRVVKYNPNALKVVWVQVDGGRYIETPFADLTIPDLSISERKIAIGQLKEKSEYQGASRAQRQSLVIRQSAKNRDLVAGAQKSTKRMRKAVENAQQTKFSESVSAIRPAERSQPGESGMDYTKPPKKFEVDL